MPSQTFRTAGDGKNHSLRERVVNSTPNQRVTLVQLPVDLAGVSTGLGSGYLICGLGGLDLPLAVNASFTYHHSDPSHVQWNDLGQVLVISVIWSPDDYAPIDKTVTA